MSAKIVEVVVGVLIREDGRILLNSRPEGKPYAGYWEFPGGKIEQGESAEQALQRELQEELGIEIKTSYPWFVKEHSYEHAKVRLHFRISREFTDTAVAREGQEFGFFNSKERTPGVILPANTDVIKRAEMPEFFEQNSDYKIIGKDTLFATIERSRDVKYLGAYVSTKNEVLKALAMDFDFVVVDPQNFEETLKDGEPLLPTYVKTQNTEQLIQWRVKGAHGLY